MGFVFYDSETTGLNKGFDQIVQLAAIRTDARLNELERFEVRCRLLPYIVPHPRALLTNGLSIERLIDRTLPSYYEMIRMIRAKFLSWSPSIFLGYNSLRFDEEMLRHAFFQNLLPAYLTSQHGNCRSDVLNLAMAAAAAQPANLELPSHADGRRSFRLEDFAIANGLQTGVAHDAMSDVVTTVKLCQLIASNAPDLWQCFVRFSNKKAVADFVENEDGFFLSEFFKAEAYHSAVVCIGADPSQSTVRLCLMLDEDISTLASMSDSALAIRLTSKPSPIRRLRTNAAPALTAFYDAPEFMIADADIGEMEERARLIKADQAFRTRLTSACVSLNRQHQPSPLIEKQLYDGFVNPPDERLLEEFHTLDWSNRSGVLDRLTDERARYFGRRLIYCENRAALQPQQAQNVERAFADRLISDASGGLTIPSALRELDDLAEAGTSDPGQLLRGYRKFLIARENRVREYTSKFSAV